MRPVASPAPFRSDPKTSRASNDGATTSPSPVSASSAEAALIDSVAEDAPLTFKAALLPG
jgi:hypothetical protein